MLYRQNVDMFSQEYIENLMKIKLFKGDKFTDFPVYLE